MTKKILVYADWVGLPDTMLIGLLTSDIVRGKEVFSFEYTEEWVKSSQSQYLDSGWRKIAAKYKLSNREQNAMAEAFWSE